jgi:hypothetical protein
MPQHMRDPLWRRALCCGAVIALSSCSSFDLDLGHLRWTNQDSNEGPYESQIDRGQLELAKEAMHNAELRRALTGYAK